MKKKILLVAAAWACTSFSAWAADAPVKAEMQAALDTFSDGCKAELTSFCKDVTPGVGRTLACLYAFEDKLSPRCDYAVYNSLSQLNRTITNISYAVNECEDDLKALCSDVKVGKGRVLDCLKGHGDKVSSRCTNALKELDWLK